MDAVARDFVQGLLREHAANSQVDSVEASALVQVRVCIVFFVCVMLVLTQAQVDGPFCHLGACMGYDKYQCFFKDLGKPWFHVSSKYGNLRNWVLMSILFCCPSPPYAISV
jgi:hypothetical protein